MANQLPARKIIRLPEYDYSSVGTYFITICTKDRRCILRHHVGTAILSRGTWFTLCLGTWFTTFCVDHHI